MEFRTIHFDFTIQGFNKKLGISKDVEIDYYKDSASIIWHSNLYAREWGIKAIRSFINEIDITIHYRVKKEHISDKEIKHLLSLGLKEFYEPEETEEYINGKLKINGKDYKVNNQMEFTGDILKINELIIDFIDNEIVII